MIESSDSSMDHGEQKLPALVQDFVWRVDSGAVESYARSFLIIFNLVNFAA
jgi:hypothetical protein